MNVLFVHQNFPAQFRHIAGALAADPGCRVAAIGSASARTMPGVALHSYTLGPQEFSAAHAFARRFDSECRRAEQVLYVATELLASGFVPDVVVVHGGWGEALPLRAAFPKARIAAYCEYYYRSEGSDVGFDPEEAPLSRDGEVALRVRNAASLLALAECDLGLSPTEWQRSTFPAEFRHKITVCHEGIDTVLAAPDPAATVSPRRDLVLRPGDEVVTFVARNLEPMRGYPNFMRALRHILSRRPRAHALIVGAEGASYGAPAPGGDSWKAIGLRAVERELDMGRVHFLGKLPYTQYLRVLQVSAAHVYLTYPFVLSWSMLEAMSAGCAVVASDTAPCREVIDGTNGLLVEFFDSAALSDAVVGLLADPARAAGLGRAARRTVERSYERDACVAKMRQLLDLGR